MNRAERRAQRARTRKLLSGLGVATHVDAATGEEVVKIDEVIQALGLTGEDAEQERQRAIGLGAKHTRTEPMQ